MTKGRQFSTKVCELSFNENLQKINGIGAHRETSGMITDHSVICECISNILMTNK